jgi:hypothetical protein
VRIDALARRPADGLRRVADPAVFAFTTQVITHVIWKAFALPEAALPVVVDIACSSFALTRLAAIGRLARGYRATADVDVSREAAASHRTSPWTIASATCGRIPRTHVRKAPVDRPGQIGRFMARAPDAERHNLAPR